MNFWYDLKLSYFADCEKNLAISTSPPPAVNPFMRIVQQSQQQQQTQTSPLFGQPTVASFQQQPTSQPTSGLFQKFSAQSSQPSQPSMPTSNPFSKIAQPSTNTAFPSQFSSPQVFQPPHPTTIFQTQTGLQFPQSGMFSNLPASQVAAVPTPSSFGSSGPGLFQQPSFQTSANLTGNSLDYSPMDELDTSELNEFKSNEFTIGRIPVRPPPRELC